MKDFLRRVLALVMAESLLFAPGLWGDGTLGEGSARRVDAREAENLEEGGLGEEGLPEDVLAEAGSRHKGHEEPDEPEIASENPLELFAGALFDDEVSRVGFQGGPGLSKGLLFHCQEQQDRSKARLGDEEAGTKGLTLPWEHL